MTYVTLSALWLASRGSYKETTEGHNSHEPNLQNKIEALGNEKIYIILYLLSVYSRSFFSKISFSSD